MLDIRLVKINLKPPADPVERVFRDHRFCESGQLIFFFVGKGLFNFAVGPVNRLDF